MHEANRYFVFFGLVGFPIILSIFDVSRGSKLTSIRYIIPFFLSFGVFLIALVIYDLIFEFESKELNLDYPFVLNTVPTLLGLFILMYPDSGSRAKCNICKNKAKDKLHNGKKEKTYCRSHLVETYRKEFLSFPHDTVVIYPDFETINKPGYYYGFSSVAQLKKSNLEKLLGEFTRNNLALVNGKCNECENDASVAYFPKGSFKWENDWPQLEKIVTNPKILCKN